MAYLPLAGLLGIARFLKIRFPKHNDGFAYSTRLGEEVGELTEAHLSYELAAIIAESQDVLRVSAGLITHYSLPTGNFPDNLLVICPPHSPGTISDELLWLSRYAGHVCSAVSHAEDAGTKRAKHGPTEIPRLQAGITGVIGTVIGLINRYKAGPELAAQTHAAYLRYTETSV